MNARTDSLREQDPCATWMEVDELGNIVDLGVDNNPLSERMRTNMARSIGSRSHQIPGLVVLEWIDSPSQAISTLVRGIWHIPEQPLQR